MFEVVCILARINGFIAIKEFCRDFKSQERPSEMEKK